MGARRKAREAALQAIYLADVGRLPVGQALDGVLQGDAMDQTTRGFARRLALGTLARLAEIDAIIARAAANWEVGRMAALDRLPANPSRSRPPPRRPPTAVRHSPSSAPSGSTPCAARIPKSIIARQ